MKKVKLFISLLAVLLLIGCSSKGTENQVKSLEYEDFSFYDHTGREVDFLTSENNSLSVYAGDEDADSIQTYRGVRIGDRATTALSEYNLSDFDWSIKTDYIINAEEHRAQANKLERKYEDLTSEEMLQHIPEITAIDNMQIIFSCDMYEYEGKLYLLYDVPRTALLSGVPKYHLSIYVKAEKISGIVISYDK